jgi:hypothetical protein
MLDEETMKKIKLLNDSYCMFEAANVGMLHAILNNQFKMAQIVSEITVLSSQQNQ